MATVPLLSDTNMATMTVHEDTLYTKHIQFLTMQSPTRILNNYLIQ